MDRPTRPPDPELLGFLQTLVNEGTGQQQQQQQQQQQDRTDSDKENEQTKMQEPQNFSGAGGESSKQESADDVWNDFYNEDDFRPKPGGTNSSSAVADHKAADADYGRDKFESLERVEEEEEGEEGGGNDDNEVSEERQQGETGSDSPGRGPKPKKKRRLFTKVRRPPSAKNTPDLSAPNASGGSHPDLSGGRGERVGGGGAGLHNHHQQETMSETSGRCGRRLSRRKQVARPRCAGPEPAGDRLQQKYQELQMLMVRPLVEPGQYVQQTRQQLRRLEGLSRQHAEASLANSLLPPAGALQGVRGEGHRGGASHNGQTDSGNRQAFIELTENNTQEGYSTLRTVQVTNHAASRRPRSAQHRKLRPTSANTGRGRPLSASQQRTVIGVQTTNSRDRVLDYVATSGGNSRGARRGKSAQKHTTNTNISSNNNPSTNTDTGESTTNEISNSSSSHNNNDTVFDNGDGKGEKNSQVIARRARSSSSERNRSESSNSRSRSGSGRRARSKSSSPFRSPRHTDTHLKHSNNPALQKWLRHKNKEQKQRKKEEKAQLLAERLEKQEEKRKRENLFKDSDKKVKEWMSKKRKEAARQAKEERRRIREEDKAREERENIQQQYNSPFRLTERPQTAPNGPVTHSGRKLFIPVIRPERPIAGGGSSSNKDAQQNANNATDTEVNKDKGTDGGESEVEPKIPRPPLASKFVYRRPVSGRVRLMKLQQEKKADAKRTELEKMLHEKKLAEEKARKMRMSYDQWLLKKRSEDYSKRQDAARQRALAKSDPELERIVPEVARRRIENIQRGKRRVNTGNTDLDLEVNKSFGGADFNSEGDTKTRAGTNSYRLEVSGSQSSLKQRPSSAKASFNPGVSKSPRRPQSAHPRVKSVMDQSDTQKNAFKLPFPAENGAPKHVLAKQDKLFSQHLTHPPSPEQSDSQNQESSPKETTQDTSPAAPSVESQPPPQGTQQHQQQVADSKTEGEAQDISSSFFVTDGNIEQHTDDTENAHIGSEESSKKGEETNSAEDIKQEISAEEEIEETGASAEQQDMSSTAAGEDAAVEETDKHTGISNNVETVNAESKDPGKTCTQETSDSDEAVCVEPTEEMNSSERTIEQPRWLAYDENTVKGEEDKAPLILDLNKNDDDKEEFVYEEDGEEEKQLEEGTTEGASTLQVKEDEAVQEGRWSRHSNKRVSFQEETQVYKPPDLDDLPDEEFYDDDDIRNDGIDDNDEDDDDDEAEDERGNYFGVETPREEDDDDAF